MFIFIRFLRIRITKCELSRGKGERLIDLFVKNQIQAEIVKFPEINMETESNKPVHYIKKKYKNMKSDNDSGIA